MNLKKYLIAGLLSAISLTGLLIGSSSVSAAPAPGDNNLIRDQFNGDSISVPLELIPKNNVGKYPIVGNTWVVGDINKTINNIEIDIESYSGGDVYFLFCTEYLEIESWAFVSTENKSKYSTYESAYITKLSLGKNLIRLEHLVSAMAYLGEFAIFMEDIPYNPISNDIPDPDSPNNFGNTFNLKINNIQANVPGDFTNPVISGVNYSVVSNVENPFTFSEIISGIKAIDNTDGDITNQITYTTNYPRNNDFSSLKLGNYTVQASVSDKAGNKSNFDFTIYVIDINAPTFTGTTTYSQSYTSKLSLDTIKSKITVNDSYEGNIPSSSWTLVSDSYSENYHKVGYYEVKYKAADKSGNEVLIVIGLNVIDDVAPVIEGANTITKNQDVVLTASTILQNYTASDAVDGVITSSIKIKTDNYTGKGATVGTHTLILTVSDKAGNSTDFTIEIIVVDNIPPVYYLDQDTIIVSSSTALTKTQMISILRQMGKIDPAALNYVTLTSKYFENANIADNYIMKVLVNSTSGVELEEEFNIRVTEAKTDELKVDKAFELKDFISENKFLIITILLASGLIATIVLSTKNGRKRSKKRYKR